MYQHSEHPESDSSQGSRACNNGAEGDSHGFSPLRASSQVEGFRGQSTDLLGLGKQSSWLPATTQMLFLKQLLLAT